MILSWHPSVPPEIRAAARPAILSSLWVLPAWLRELRVTWWPAKLEEDGLNLSAAADMDAEPDYLYANLTLFSTLLEDSPEERRRIILHEMLHVVLEPMVREHSDFVDEMFCNHEEPSKHKMAAERAWKSAYERTIQELSYALRQIPVGATRQVEVTEEATSA